VGGVEEVDKKKGGEGLDLLKRRNLLLKIYQTLKDGYLGGCPKTPRPRGSQKGKELW